MRLKGLLKRTLGAPSVFDISVILFILMPVVLHVGFLNRGINVHLLQAIWFVFGTIFLMCLALYVPKYRDYKSLPLALLTIVSLVNVYIHAFKPMMERIQPTGIAVGEAWITWELMCESFMYIFFGVYLIYTIVKYSKAWRWFYVPIGLCVGYYLYMVGFNGQHLAKVYMEKGILKEIACGWSMTPILALCVGGVLTLVRIPKMRLWSGGGILIGAFVAINKWSHLVDKWISRPDFWQFTLKRITMGGLWGNGTYHTINTMNGLVASDHTSGLVERGTATYVVNQWGNAWRQCDILEYGEYAGWIAMALVSWYILRLFMKAKPGLAYWLGLSGIIMTMVQRTIFFPAKALIIVVLISMVILESGLARDIDPLLAQKRR